MEGPGEESAAGAARGRLARLGERLAVVPLGIAAAALFALMLMTLADVVLRSTLSAPLAAATELTRILVATVVFAALPVVSARGEHIAVDLLDRWFGPRASRLRDALIALVCGVLLWWPLERVLALAARARDYGDVTEYLAIPQYLVAYGIATGLALTMLVLLARSAALFAGAARRDDDAPPESDRADAARPDGKRRVPLDGGPADGVGGAGDADDGTENG